MMGIFSGGIGAALGKMMPKNKLLDFAVAPAIPGLVGAALPLAAGAAAAAAPIAATGAAVDAAQGKSPNPGSLLTNGLDPLNLRKSLGV